MYLCEKKIDNASCVGCFFCARLLLCKTFYFYNLKVGQCPNCKTLKPFRKKIQVKQNPNNI